MRIEIITIFPEMFSGFLGESIIKKAIEKELVKINTHDLRQWTTDKRKTVDDRPFGGGPGMVMMYEPIAKAVVDVKASFSSDETVNVVVTSAKGNTYTQQLAVEFSSLDGLIIICGRYEGIDERVMLDLADHELSIGNYVLTGGEIPAMVIADSVTRLLPDVLGNEQSLVEESFSDSDLQEYPQYTRPAEIVKPTGEILAVPDVLLSGDHGAIGDWREKFSGKIKTGSTSSDD